jgi:hypothetical protein
VVLVRQAMALERFDGRFALKFKPISRQARLDTKKLAHAGEFL